MATLIFDFDGTIHESINIYYPAFLKGYNHLVQIGVVNERQFAIDEVSKWLGFSSDAMWEAFLPDVDMTFKMEAKKIIGSEMRRLLNEGCGNLYPEAEKVLFSLKEKGHKLIFLSNCGILYMETARDVFKLDRYFDLYFCSEQFNQLPKWEILRLILNNKDYNVNNKDYNVNEKEYNLKKHYVIIGDRFHDIEAGLKNGIYTVACAYGYGNLDEFEGADEIIESISELEDMF